jgi:hypothetical protein
VKGFLIRIARVLFVISVFVFISMLLFWARKDSEDPFREKDTENERLFVASKNHFNFVWYDARNRLNENYAVDSIDRQMIIAGENSIRSFSRFLK